MTHMGPMGSTGRPLFGALLLIAAGAAACATGASPPRMIDDQTCGLRVTSSASFAIATLTGSVRLEGLPDDQIIDRGVNPGETRWFLVGCWARCVVVQGAGREPTTGRTVRFEGAADLRPGEFAALRLERRTGTRNAQQAAAARGCVAAD